MSDDKYVEEFEDKFNKIYTNQGDGNIEIEWEGHTSKIKIDKENQKL